MLWVNKRNDAVTVAHSTLFRFGLSVEVAACTQHLTFMKTVCVDHKRITNNRNVEWMCKLDSTQHRFILTITNVTSATASTVAQAIAMNPQASIPIQTSYNPTQSAKAAVMVYPLVLHVPPMARPISDVSDRPPTPLGRQSTSHSLSWTLVCFYYPSLLVGFTMGMVNTVVFWSRL